MLDEHDKIFNPQGTFVHLENCIIWGNLEEEIQFLNQGGQPFVSHFEYNILKTNLKNFPSTNIINENPLFKNPNESDFQLDSLSPAQNRGQISSIKFDLIHQIRDAKPDIGAYERAE